MGAGDHDCEWRQQAEKLASELAEERSGRAALNDEVPRLAAIVEKLQRHAFGRRSEKIPSVDEELRRSGVTADPEVTQEKRRANAEKKRGVVTREIRHEITEDQKTCPKCGGHEFTPLGSGKITELYELLPSIIAITDTGTMRGFTFAGAGASQPAKRFATQAKLPRHRAHRRACRPPRPQVLHSAAPHFRRVPPAALAVLGLQRLRARAVPAVLGPSLLLLLEVVRELRPEGPLDEAP